jgi:hypothetical protein
MGLLHVCTQLRRETQDWSTHAMICTSFLFFHFVNADIRNSFWILGSEWTTLSVVILISRVRTRNGEQRTPSEKRTPQLLVQVFCDLLLWDRDVWELLTAHNSYTCTVAQRRLVCHRTPRLQNTWRHELTKERDRGHEEEEYFNGVAPSAMIL